MESQLLNAFHDDHHFDDNYINYDATTANYWSDGTDTLGLQLTETLHGILPISPTDDEKQFFSSDSECETNISSYNRLQNDNNNDIKQNIYELQNNNYYTHYTENDIYENMSPSIEIISVDPNCEFNSPINIDSDSEDDDDEDEEDDVEAENEDTNEKIQNFNQNLSYYSSSSSTSSGSSDDSSDTNSSDDDDDDSSSIGDYISRSSDDDNYNKNKIIFQQTENLLDYDNLMAIDDELISPISNDHVQFVNQHNNLIIDTNQFNNIIPKNNNNSNSNILFDMEINNTIKLIDTESLESEIDIKHFDLAAFITEEDDDFNLIDKRNCSILKDIKPIGKKIQNHDTINDDTTDDDEDDDIIDIESIHDNTNTIVPPNNDIDLNDSFTTIIENDDPIRDPSWCPKSQTTKSQQIKTRSKTRQQTNKLNNNIKNSKSIEKKSQNRVLESKKYGLGRGKNISMCSKPTEISTNDFDSNKSKDNDLKNIKELNNDDLIKRKNCAIINDCKIEKQIQSKQILKPENSQNALNNRINKNSKDIINEKIFIEETAKSSSTNLIKIEDVIENNIKEEIIEEIEEEEILPIIVKKKLNLEEYKKRCREKQEYHKNDDEKPILISNNKMNKSSIIQETEKKILPTGTSIQKDNKLIKNELNNRKNPPKTTYDPILEAKNKVLRMQEMKKIARTKLIDSQVSSKVGPITKILPLEEITSMASSKQNKTTAISKEKSSSNLNQHMMKINPDYEEIIIVSASTNTDITLPPIFQTRNTTSNLKSSSTSSSSSSLLLNINNTIQKHVAKSTCGDIIKISSNSLISSIQDVVLKKSNNACMRRVVAVVGNTIHKSPNIGVSPPSQYSPEKPEMSQTDDLCNLTKLDAIKTEKSCQEDQQHEHHGEDKIIMHLRKDRIRPKQYICSTQTLELPEFPPLELLKKIPTKQQQKENKRDRDYRKYNSNSIKHHRSSISTDDDYDNHRRSRSRYHSISSQGTNRSISPRNNNTRTSSNNNNNHYRTSYSPSSYRRSRREQLKRNSRSRSHTKSSRHCSVESEKCSSSRDEHHHHHQQRNSYERKRRRSSRQRSTSSSKSNSSYSRSRTRSRSRSRYTKISRPNNNNNRRHNNTNTNTNHRNVSPAVEERRIVYVGRIENETTKDDLKRKFSSYGPVRQITLHYKDTGMKYGFVTFERAQDAYQAIDNGLHDKEINMYDISFGGRRAFCGATYSDLDGAATGYSSNSNNQKGYSSSRNTNNDDSFEALLKKVKEKITKSTTTTTTSSTTNLSHKM